MLLQSSGKSGSSPHESRCHGDRQWQSWGRPVDFLSTMPLVTLPKAVSQGRKNLQGRILEPVTKCVHGCHARLLPAAFCLLCFTPSSCSCWRLDGKRGGLELCHQLPGGAAPEILACGDFPLGLPTPWVQWTFKSFVFPLLSDSLREGVCLTLAFKKYSRGDADLLGVLVFLPPQHTEADFKSRLKSRPELEELLAQMN